MNIIPTSTTNNKDIAAAYIRVSTIKQKDKGYSIETQTELAKKYADEHGWLLPNDLIFIENKPATKVEGKNTDKENLINYFKDRPKLQTLLDKASYNKFNHLILYSRDRLSRVLQDYTALNFFLNKYNIDVHYTKIGENLNSEDYKINRLLDLVLSSVAEFEASLLSSRVKEGNRACLFNNIWPGGKAPLGYTLQTSYNKLTKKHNSILEKSNIKCKIVNDIFKYYLEGFGYKRIADKMKLLYPSEKWTKSKIQSIINNETYTGKIAWDRRGGRRNPKKHEKITFSDLNKNNIIIDKNTWEDTINTRNKRNKTRDAFFYDTPFIFKNKLICSKCGRLMIPKNPGKDRTNVYKCSTAKDEDIICNCIIPSLVIEQEFNKHIKEIFKFNDYEYLWNLYTKKFDTKIKELKENINTLDKKITEYKNLLNEVNKCLLEETNAAIKESLKTQCLTCNATISKYNSIKRLAENEIKLKKIDKCSFIETIKAFPENLFDKEYNNVAPSNELQISKRMFIIKFIDKIIVDYDSANKKILNMEIHLLSPEFI